MAKLNHSAFLKRRLGRPGLPLTREAAGAAGAVADNGNDKGIEFRPVMIIRQMVME